MSRDMADFDLTFEIANQLNKEPHGSTRHVLPSEVNFELTMDVVKRVDEQMEELAKLLKYSDQGNAYETYESLVETWGRTLRECEGKPLMELLHKFYGNLFYHSDRWCLFRYKTDHTIWECIKSTWKPN